MAVWSQQTDYVDFQQAEVDIVINPDLEKVSGAVSYTFSVLKPIDSVFVDAKKMQIDSVDLNGRDADYSYIDNRLIIRNNSEWSKSNEIVIHYQARPKRAMYFIRNKTGEIEEVWTQGQGKYTSHWLPSLDDMNDKIEFDLKIAVPSEYEVIANGALTQVDIMGSGLTEWSYNMDLPMSCYLVAVGIGRFEKQQISSASGVPIDLYYYPKDSLKFEPTYRNTRQIFDFLETEIGVAYPWQNYKQLPLQDFLYAGMENTGTTFFSNEFMVDSIGYNDRNYININAHELAHQWFGNLVTETSGTHHWLHEGFATYYAWLSERFLFGENHFYWILYESALKLEQQDLAGKSTSLLNPESSSLTFYEKGAWTLFMLKELVGEQIFREAVKTYLKDFRFRNVSTPDFLGLVEQLSGRDLDAFANEWLISDDFPVERALDALKQNSIFINEYLMVDCEVVNSKCSEQLRSPISDWAKIKIIEQRPGLVMAEDFNNSWRVRQAIALNLGEIPLELKTSYESLLDDPSYITQEAALYNLWINFPAYRNGYLNKMASVKGLADLNVRMLWLVLSLNTENFMNDKKGEFFSELIGYTSRGHNASVRIRAFNYLIMLNGCESQCVNNLKDATKHHNWQLVKFAREELAKLDKE